MYKKYTSMSIFFFPDCGGEFGDHPPGALEIVPYKERGYNQMIKLCGREIRCCRIKFIE